MKHCGKYKAFIIVIYSQLGQRIRKLCCCGQTSLVSLIAFILMSHLDLNPKQLIKMNRNQLTPIYSFWESANSPSFLYRGWHVIFETYRKRTVHKFQENPNPWVSKPSTCGWWIRKKRKRKREERKKEEEEEEEGGKRREKEMGRRRR